MAFKDILLNIVVRKVKKEYFVTINGEETTPKLMGDSYGMNPITIRNNLSSNTVEQFTMWLQNRLELNKLGIDRTCRLFKRDGDVCWTTCLRDIVGCSTSNANNRLHTWQNGVGDLDDLFNPLETQKTMRMGSDAEPMWGGLSNKKRDINLRGMKNPGKWEKKLRDPLGFSNASINHHIGHFSGGNMLRGD